MTIGACKERAGFQLYNSTNTSFLCHPSCETFSIQNLGEDSSPRRRRGGLGKSRGQGLPQGSLLSGQTRSGGSFGAPGTVAAPIGVPCGVGEMGAFGAGGKHLHGARVRHHTHWTAHHWLTHHRVHHIHTAHTHHTELEPSFELLDGFVELACFENLDGLFLHARRLLLQLDEKHAFLEVWSNVMTY